MTTDDIFKSITDKLLTLPDQSGLAKCAGFYLVYQGVEALKTAFAEERNAHETEKRALMDRIKELEKGEQA